MHRVVNPVASSGIPNDPADYARENACHGVAGNSRKYCPVEASPACACGSMQPAVARTPPMKTSTGRSRGKSDLENSGKTISPTLPSYSLTLEKHSKRGFQGSKRPRTVVISVAPCSRSDNIACLMTELIGVPVDVSGTIFTVGRIGSPLVSAARSRTSRPDLARRSPAGRFSDPDYGSPTNPA